MNVTTHRITAWKNHLPVSLAIAGLAATIAASIPVHAREDVGCYSVDAKRGWQYLQLSNTYSKVVSIRGEWTVDVVNQEETGASGYAELSTEYEGGIYDESLPLGSLLIGVPGDTYTLLSEPQPLTQAVTNVALRINDNDFALGDNYGVLRVCFSN